MQQQDQGQEPALFEGLKVLDVGTWIAGPVATTMLADYGADVIKIEMPGVGDAYRQFALAPTSPAAEINYTWLMDARNKRSLTLNLKDPRGREILHRLVVEADVYVTNHPLAMRRSLGLTYEDLKPLNERLVYASLTAYGEHGPERDREGFDLVAYWSRAGLMDQVRIPHAEPAQSLPGMGDHPTAVSMYASIVTALLRRERTGKGSLVHTSLLANGLWAASCIAQAAFAGADFSHWHVPGRLAPTRSLYETSDRRWLQLTMIRTPEEFSRLLDVLGLKDLLDDPRFATPEARLQNGTELVVRLREVIAQNTSDYWLTACRGQGVPIAMMGTLHDLLEDPQVEANGMVESPGVDIGMTRVIRHPVNVEGAPRTPLRQAPGIGEHNGEILSALGYSASDVQRLAHDGVI
ncbi:MAG: CoA transferase [Pseudomonadales bacterium]